MVYSDVASAQQKHAMYRELWGAEFGLFKESELTTLAGLFESDPISKPRVLRR